MEKEKKYDPLRDKSLDFAVRIVNMCSFLREKNKNM